MKLKGILDMLKKKRQKKDPPNFFGEVFSFSYHFVLPIILHYDEKILFPF